MLLMNRNKQWDWYLEANTHEALEPKIKKKK